MPAKLPSGFYQESSQMMDVVFLHGLLPCGFHPADAPYSSPGMIEA